jgi:hypothetical protein
MTRRSLLVLAPLLLLVSACKEDLVCPQGETACSGKCVSLLEDDANCGTCGAAVDRPLRTCEAGVSVCDPLVALCGDACTDLLHDPDNCGTCGNACGPQELCATTGGGTCTPACADGLEACGRSCVTLATDAFHCGACGRACAAGEACVEGTCRAAVFAACVNTNEVVSLTRDLSRAGSPWNVPSGPTALALRGDVLYSANGWPAASVSVLPLDRALGSQDVPLSGADLQNVFVHDDLLLVSNAESGSIVVLSASGGVVDEIPLPDQEFAPNPHGVAISGTSAYVALYGRQEIAKLDVTGLSSCGAPDPGAPACGEGGACPAGRACRSGTCRLLCGAVESTIDLLAIPGTFDGDAHPAPSDVVAAAGLVFVGLSNLADDENDPFPFWVIPSGPGKLAVIDPSFADTVTLLELGPDCWKPGPITLRGSTLWVGCGSLSFPDRAPGALVPIDLSSGTPSVGPAIDIAPVVPGALAFCAGIGYVADQASGKVLMFDPDAATTRSTVTVCPTGPFGFTAVSDIACAD